MALQAQVQLPHNLDAILQEADLQINKSSDNVIEQLHGGIFLNQNKLKFSVDKLSGANTFEIYARGLTIAWGNDERYWKWTYMQDTKDHPVEVEVAELVKVCWLDVSKKFPTQNLTPRHNYEVSFVLMKLKGCEGFQNHPVNLKLTLPNQPPMEHKQDLSILPENKWSDVPVDMFSINCCMTGDMEISMYEHGSQWKKGIVVDKIIIRPLVQPQN
ncbi:protein PHLOEM PROTEIN 2-LIKE A1-like [Pistacia vera]|uniref:protein PHLOEM PROTEIN 2-LIKE A1-like n=1 Tax=Pistacia vera TaxID=55513 RepID=UPI001262B298|nr:protein PHLOEM PROTEIN 2-LIKE A1-like [Pistacia vera]